MIQGITAALSVPVTSEEALAKISREARELEAQGTWLQLDFEPKLLAELGLGDIFDPLLDSELRVASVRVKAGPDLTEDFLEKLAIIADESQGRVAIVRAPTPSLKTLEEWYELFSTYKVKLLLEPASPQEAQRAYKRFNKFLGGVLGFSYVQESYPSTEAFLAALTPYLQLTRSVQLSNYRGGSPASVLSPGTYNNPMLLRELVQKGYRGYVVLGYERCRDLALEFLLRELRSLSSFLAALQEKL